MASNDDYTDYATIHARAIRLASRLSDLSRRLNVPEKLDYDRDTADLVHRLRDDTDLLVQIVSQNRALLEPAILFILRSNSAAEDLPVTTRFTMRLLQRCPAAETDLFRALWLRFGGAEFTAATFGNFFDALLGPLDINLDLDLQAVVRTTNDSSMVAVLQPSSDAPNAPRYFSFSRESPPENGVGHVQERTRTIRRRLEARAELSTQIIVELIRAVYRNLDAFPPGFIVVLKAYRDRPEIRQDNSDVQRRLRVVFLDAVLGYCLDKPDCFDFVPQYFLDKRTRSSLKQLSQIVNCLGSGSLTVGCSAQIINAFVEEHGVLVDQLIVDLLLPVQLTVASPLQGTPVQHVALSKSHLNAFMVAAAQRSHPNAVDGQSSKKSFTADEHFSSSKDLFLNCFDQFDTTLKAMQIGPGFSALNLTMPQGGFGKLLFECLSRLPVCGIVQSGDSFLQYLQHTLAFARLKAERHHCSDLSTVISHLSGFIGYAVSLQPEIDWVQELTSYMDTDLAGHEERIDDYLKAFESFRLSHAIVKNIIQNTNMSRDSLRAKQSVQNFIRNARFNFKVVIKNPKNLSFSLTKKSTTKKVPGEIAEIQCRSLDQIVHDLRDLLIQGSCDVVPSVLESILKRIGVALDQDLAGVADAKRNVNLFIMGRLYPHLFASASLSDIENIVLQDQLVNFSDISLEQLDIASSPILQTSLLLPISEIGKINQFISPHKKVECIVRATRQAMEALRLSASESGYIPGSDQLLPVMVFVILKARPAELQRNCCFCRLYWKAEDEFTDNADLQSLYRFCFVQFQSAVKFISQMTTGCLSRPTPTAEVEHNGLDKRALAA